MGQRVDLLQLENIQAVQGLGCDLIFRLFAAVQN